ncbi:5-aminopentanamidase [Variovorax sp. YR750]|uniref:carbon-nitrogen hydrolase family protein n=1 Tax=Variovorax sp. YR750 TaxID=1884384 RepID=UPI0008B83481|nr:carbon-nitrogen hydrolase family protein [Variovorax sp. YR750]SEL04868.1 5-aminopentanamidase [Variovorax sp. YR750]
MNELRLALLQCASAPGEVALNLQRLDHACREAAAAGMHLLVTPEMFLTGYNIGRDAAAQFAEPPGGPRTVAAGEIARRHRLAIVFGHPEHDDTGAVCNTCVGVDADGRVLGRHRKSHLFGDLDQGMFNAGRGDEPPFDFHGWKVGMLICYDVEFPENARRLALEGADLLVVPTANMEGYDFVPRHLVPTRAYENQLFVAYANFCGQEADITYDGLSCVAAPDGAVLAQAARDPSLVFARLDQSRLAAARQHLGHLALCRALHDADPAAAD